MAVNPGTKWPTRTTAPGANYPYGSSKDETSPGANDGTPYELARADDIFGSQQALLNAAGITPSGNADTVLLSQYMQAILYQLLTGDLFEDSGAADAYVLSPLTDNYAPAAYKQGSKYRWVPGNTNTGATTVNISSLGVKAIVRGGAALAAGALAAGAEVEIIWDNPNDRFELVDRTPFSGAFTSTEQTITPAGSLTLPHGLSASPSLIQCRLICKTAEHGYSIGDEAIIGATGREAHLVGDSGHAIVSDAVNLTVRYGSHSNVYVVINKTTGASTTLTTSSWRLIVKAWV